MDTDTAMTTLPYLAAGIVACVATVAIGLYDVRLAVALVLAGNVALLVRAVRSTKP